MPVVPDAEEIDLHWNLKRLHFQAELPHLLLIYSGIPGKMQDIRVGKISKAPRLQRFYGLVAVALQGMRIRSLPENIQVTYFISQTMLPEYIVLNRKLTREPDQVLKISRIVLHFQPQPDIDLPGIFLSQGKNRIHIIFQLVHPHLHMADIPFRIRHRRMVGKAQDLQSSFDRPLDIFPFRSVCVHASPCMCMIIRNHLPVFSCHLICLPGPRCLPALLFRTVHLLFRISVDSKDSGFSFCPFLPVILQEA